MKDDSNDTKNETEKRILSFFLIGQSFLKIFAGAGAKLAGRRLALIELITLESWESNIQCIYFLVKLEIGHTY